MRPQPGQAVTCGVKLRSPSACRICWRNDDFFGAIAIGQRRERGADGVADAFLQQHRERGGGGDDALRSEAGFGQAEVQRVVALGGQHAIDHDQILHAADLGAEDDFVAAEAVAFGGLRGQEGADDDGVQRDFHGVQRFGQARVFVHHAREQGLIERAPVDADAHRAVVFDGGFDHDAEIVVVLLADVDVAGIDAVFGQGARAVGIFLQQQVAVVMEVADDGHADAELVERVDDFRDGLGGGFGVDGDAHQFGAGVRQRHHLIDGGGGVGGVGIGHGLDHDGVVAAHPDIADFDGHRSAPGKCSHWASVEIPL